MVHALMFSILSPTNFFTCSPTGKISRVLAAKCALAIRVDALGDNADASIGLEARAKVEARMRQLEGKALAVEGAKPRGKEQPAKYDKTKVRMITKRPESLVW